MVEQAVDVFEPMGGQLSKKALPSARLEHLRRSALVECLVHTNAVVQELRVHLYTLLKGSFVLVLRLLLVINLVLRAKWC